MTFIDGKLIWTINNEMLFYTEKRAYDKTS